MATTQEALQVTEHHSQPGRSTICRRASRSTKRSASRSTNDGKTTATLLGVMMRAGKTQIGLSQDDWQKGRDRKKGVGVRISIQTTQNVDDIASRARSAGITLGKEPHDTEWKSRAFEVTDPTGFILTIGSEMPA